MFITFLFSLSGVLALYGIYYLLNFLYLEYTSSLRYLPGPPSPSLIFGNIKQIWQAENSVLHEQWIADYGKVIQYSTLLSAKRLYTTDHKALNYILMNSFDYQKPEPSRWALGRVVGEGLLVVEGDKHKQQRRIMNPAFGTAQIRQLTEIFVEKSLQLRDIWTAEIASKGNRIDVLSWLSRMTLDVIGLAGFNYKFDALNPNATPNELNQAFTIMFESSTGRSMLPLILAWFPILRKLPLPQSKQDVQVSVARRTMDRIGRELLHESKTSLLGTGEKGDNWGARDLLSLLVRANMGTFHSDGQKMSDDDVVSQIPTFLAAGHETTSTATTWALYALSLDPAIQVKLREELLTLDTETPTMDNLNSLTFLDYVVRETLRVHAPVPSTIRVAMKDDILPLSEPFTDTRGIVHDGIRVTKGQTLLIPILSVNRDKSLWGEDAMEFKPERWSSIPPAVLSIPGVWGNMLTFIGGPRACIGYKFSIVEIKALLFTLVRAFEFELAVPADEIKKISSIVQRPVLKSDPDGGNQMPLLIKPYQRR